MTEVTFYILETGSPEAFSAQLCKKLLDAKQTGYLYARDAGHAEQLDTALWATDPGSFLPHGRTDDGEPLLIGETDPPERFNEVLLNFAAEVPLCFSRFDRVVEVIGGSEDHKALARQRYAFYRDRGYPLKTHKIR